MRELAIIAVSLLGSLCLAQPARNVQERRADRRELASDTGERRDDRRDLATVQGLLAQFEIARAAGDLVALGRLDEAVRLQLRTERRETRTETARDRAEVRRDRSELASDRHELRRDVARGAPPRVKADDRRDLRDDRRDRRDDKADLAAEQRARATVAELSAEWAALLGKTDPESLAHKQRILERLVREAELERAQNAQELREDRRELREDRRESREDRRPRR